MKVPYTPKEKPAFDYDRPMSWSAISSFNFSKEQWYKKYVLKEEQPTSIEMEAGKKIGESFCTPNPMAPVIVYPEMEYKLEAKIDDILLVGYADSWHPEKKLLREYKTSRKKGYWNQQSVNLHGQLTMYAMMLFLSEKIRPEDITIHLDHIPVHIIDGKVEVVQPVIINTFETKRTMVDILKFMNYIKETRQNMLIYYDSK